MLKSLYLSIYYQTVIFTRIKQALFFSVAFPVFLLVVFGYIWGGAESDASGFALCTGIIALNTLSDGLYAIGPVIKQYYQSGLIKYFRKTPINILLYFLGLSIGRFLIMLLVTAALSTIAILLFGMEISLSRIGYFIIGLIAGVITFASMGLAISFANIKAQSEKGIGNFIYFTLLFTSDALYPTSEMNEYIGMVSKWLPMNATLTILRGSFESWPILLAWTALCTGFLYFFINRMQITR